MLPRRSARFLAKEPIFRRAGYAGLYTAVLCVSFFFWAKENDRHETRVRPGRHGGCRQADRRTLIQQLRALEPARETGHRCGLSERPLRGWDMTFIAELWFRDHSLRFHLQSKMPLPPEELAKMTVFDFQDGRLVQLTASPVTDGGSPRP